MAVTNIEKLRDIALTMLNNQISNYIVPGLNSSLVGDGTDKNGRIRMFHPERQTRDVITPHSHRFDFACLVLEGEVYNSIYEPVDTQGSELWCLSTIDQVCGPNGILRYTHSRADAPSPFFKVTKHYRKGDVYGMSHEEIHSIEFSANARVLFFEGPQLSKKSHMIEPWVGGKVIPTFETKDWMFQKV